MRIFISWSGETSHQVACAFRDWLPNVLQRIHPYVSSEDIDKGGRWLKDIAGELETSSFGILCVTPDNVEAPWLNFEAGALSKAFNDSRVTPFLFDLKPSDLSGPLTQFQATLNTKDDVLRLIHGINSARGDEKLEHEQVVKSFDKWWEDFQYQLTKIEVPEASKPKRTRGTGKAADGEILEEILRLSRQQSRALSTIGEAFPVDELAERLSRYNTSSVVERRNMQRLLAAIMRIHRAAHADADFAALPDSLREEIERSYETALFAERRMGIPSHLRRYAPSQRTLPIEE